MPGKSVSAMGNELFDILMYLPTVTFPTLAANASSTTTVTVPGLLPLDFVSWNLQAPAAHLFVSNMYVSAANVLTIQWGTDATGVTGATVAIELEAIRADGANLGFAASMPPALV